MWNKDEMNGKAGRIERRIKESAGQMSGDERLRNEGAADRGEGAVREVLGKGRRKVGEAIEDAGKIIKR